VRSAGNRLSAGDNAVYRKRATPLDHNRQRDPHCEQVKLETFSRLIASPVHEKSELQMRSQDRSNHDGGDTGRGNPAKEANRETDCTEELDHETSSA